MKMIDQFLALAQPWPPSEMKRTQTKTEGAKEAPLPPSPLSLSQQHSISRHLALARAIPALLEHLDLATQHVDTEAPEGTRDAVAGLGIGAGNGAAGAADAGQQAALAAEEDAGDGEEGVGDEVAEAGRLQVWSDVGNGFCRRGEEGEVSWGG
jgi:hypothetical protein